jgi:N-acetylglucosaminyldiphosphoundecaprenol N-acetyl-beta-D-mannosaminyltransferase
MAALRLALGRTIAMTSATQPVLFGLPMDAVTMPAVLARCETAIQTRKPLLIGVVNAAKVIKVRHDEDLRRSVLECDLVLADGQSVVWASRLLRKRLPERVAGIDLFEQLLILADREHRSVYLLGAKEEVLSALVDHIAMRFPGVKVAGRHNGYFTDAQAGEIAADIGASGADMLFLGMVSPKKEIFLGTWGPTLKVPVLHGVGGSFDVLAGVTKRAPQRWQRSGFEWLYRLIQEPRRLWRRYLVTNLAFIALTARELVKPVHDYRLDIAKPAADARPAVPSA